MYHNCTKGPLSGLAREKALMNEPGLNPAASEGI